MKKTERKTKTTPVKRAGKTSAPSERGSSSAEKNDENEVGEFPSITEIKELIEIVSEKDFNEFELKRGGFRLLLRKGLGEPASAPGQREHYVTSPAGESVPVDYVSPSYAAAQPAPASSRRTARPPTASLRRWRVAPPRRRP